jgi:hypothetical protein
MCVIMAKKSKLKNSNKENWFLYKIRDRAYSPKYKLEVEKKKNVETLFLIDQDTSWSEGVNSKGVMIVSAALDNHSDLDDNGSGSSGNSAAAGQMEKTKALRAAISSESVDDALQILIKDRFIGTSFISDGDRLIILEIYVNDKAYQREIDKLIKKHGKKYLESMKIVDQVYKIMEGITEDDYDVKYHEVVKDKLAVRTNHGKLLPDAGYQEDDKDKAGWNSSQKRYSYTYRAMENIGECHPFEALTVLKNLHGLEKNPQNNPIRVKEGATKDKPYYSSTVVMLTPTGTMFAVPLDSEVDEKSRLTLKPDRNVDFVMLPKNLPLFESFSFRDIIYTSLI